MNDEFIIMLYSDYYKKVAYVIKSQIYSNSFADIEDCVQEVFLIVTKKVQNDSLPDHPNILGWLCSIAKNVANKFNDRYIKNKTIVLEKTNDIESIFKEDDFSNQITEDIIYKDINQDELIMDMKKFLLKNERDLFELKFEKKLSNKEISVIMNKSEDAIKAKCSRIKQKTKILIENL